MISSLLGGIVSFISSLGSIYTAPINAVITNFFPDLTNMLSTITSVFNNVFSIIGWFMNLIPPTARTVMISILMFWLSVWPLRVAVWNVSFGLNFIKRINIFSSK